MAIKGGRQIAPTIAEIRADHVARYHFARGHIEPGASVLDLGCGCGYGSSILSEKAGQVTGIDADRDAISYAKEHYGAENIAFRIAKAESKSRKKYDAVVAFEVIEHVEDAQAVLAHLATVSPVLIGSVPNENVVPFDAMRNPYHVRHYTPQQLTRALEDAGWTNVQLLSQADKRGLGDKIRVLPNARGRTLVFMAKAG